MSEIKTPLAAIRQFCYECSGESRYEVKRCTGETCALFPFRFGKNPYLKGRVMSEEQKEQARARLAKYRGGSEDG